MISEKHLTCKVIVGSAETNELTWDDQWVSFNDAGTLAKKPELANDRCLGGTALWAIDYATCLGGGSSPHPQPQPARPSPSSFDRPVRHSFRTTSRCFFAIFVG
jgi:hypothetical protein